MLTRPSLQDLDSRIQTDLSSRLTSNSPLILFLKVMARTIAGGWYELYGMITKAAISVLPSKATGSDLDDLLTSYNVSARKPATYSQGNANLVNSTMTDITIPAGTEFTSEVGLVYATLADVDLDGDGSGSVSMICLTVGTLGNLFPGSVLNYSGGLGIMTATLDSGATGGGAKESDLEVRTRLLNAIRNPALGGSQSDYVKWALSVLGVQRAWCIPNYVGIGTVGVVIMPEGGGIASDALIATVAAYIETQRPVGADVRVLGVNVLTGSMSIDITPRSDTIAAALMDRINKFLVDEMQPGGVLYISRLNKVIGDASIQDFKITSLIISDLGDSFLDPVNVTNNIQFSETGWVSFEGAITVGAL